MQAASAPTYRAKAQPFGRFGVTLIVAAPPRIAAAFSTLAPASAVIGGADAKAAGAGHVDGKGLDGALSPGEVLPKAAPFIKTPVTANSLV